MNTTEGQIRTSAGLGDLLRRHRKSRGLSQVDAAALAGVGPRFLSELERGKATAEIGLVLRVLDRFGLKVVIAQRDGTPVSAGHS